MLTDIAAMRFTGIGKQFDTGTVALEGVDLTVAAGECVSVVGPSGCGKSTLLRLASGLSRPSAGEITLHSDRISYVFQDPTLLPWRSALSNVELVGELHRLPKAVRREKALAALTTVGLTGFEKQLPAQLSGGMRMRVSMARALVLEPDIFLFDEPFGALDEITRLRMQEELQRLLHTSSFSALFITHSVSEAVYLSNRVVVMSARPGRILHEVTVPFAYPRRPEIRYEAEFGRLAGEVSAALLEGHA
ncbi:MAG TPA: ABC transporter ATP-binding protein [Mycobacteriales bacterium]|jgi:NitT/TauT family transport system ATP-binding protein|nr:ABC transporter ATP-binding protein [Mycobacteriales bacterium]